MNFQSSSNYKIEQENSLSVKDYFSVLKMVLLPSHSWILILFWSFCDCFDVQKPELCVENRHLVCLSEQINVVHVYRFYCVVPINIGKKKCIFISTVNWWYKMKECFRIKGPDSLFVYMTVILNAFTLDVCTPVLKSVEKIVSVIWFFPSYIQIHRDLYFFFHASKILLFLSPNMGWNRFG